jgi:hypothetical protein
VEVTPLKGGKFHFSTLKKMEIWSGRSLQWGCVAGRVQAPSWKTMAKYYTTQNPRILSVKKITFVFRSQKVRMRWRLAKKIPEEDSEQKVSQLLHRSLVRMRRATLVLSCHHLQMKRITAYPVQSYKCGFECAHCKRKSNAKSDMMRPMNDESEPAG